jgi:hypothetical protein
MGRAAKCGAVLLPAIFLVSQMTGCGLFEPRDPRPGGGGPSVNCATPNSPDSVVSNVVDHYADLASVSCYTDMLDPSFAFHPDVADSNELRPGDTAYVNWTRDVESRNARNIAADATFHVASFDSEYAARFISADQRTQIHFYAYHLIIRAPDVAPDTLFQGLADITFFQGGDAQWHITDWVDRRDGSGARTWGYLRRIYRVGF